MPRGSVPAKYTTTGEAAQTGPLRRPRARNTIASRPPGYRKSRMIEIYREIVRLVESGEKGALATVVGSTGSTPGKEAAKMLVRADGTTVGTIGGGCTEADVWALAREVIATDRPLRRSFKLTPRAAEEGGLACG